MYRDWLGLSRREGADGWATRGHLTALHLSTAWHAGAVLGAALAPGEWPLWLGGTVLNHALVVAPGLWPRSSMLGPNWTRLPEASAHGDAIAITIDDGPDPEITPRVLDILDEYGAFATFFCIGERAQRHSALTREIVARGHAVENHSQRHRHNFSVSGPGTVAREVDSAQQALTDITGQRPIFFRAPAGLRNVFLEPVLQRHDLRLAAWTRRGFDSREWRPERIYRRLVSGLAARDILLLHDGCAALSPEGRSVVLDALPMVLKEGRQQGLRFVTLREAALNAGQYRQMPVSRTL